MSRKIVGLVLVSGLCASMPRVCLGQCSVYINEIIFGSVGEPTYVELYNAGETAIPLGGWSIRFENECIPIDPLEVINPGEYKLVPDPTGALDPANGGETALFDNISQQQDRVVFGNEGSAPCQRGPAPWPLAGGIECTVSTARAPDAADGPPRILDSENSGHYWTLDFSPTCEGRNDAPNPALGTSLRLNEVSLGFGGAFFEIFSPDTLGTTTDLAGWFVAFGGGSSGTLPLGGSLAPGERATFELTPPIDSLLYLFDADSVRVDQIGLARAPQVGDDQCYGRYPDGAGASNGYNFESSDLVVSFCSPDSANHPLAGSLTLSIASDGTYEDAYAWGGIGAAMPDIGAFAECFSGARIVNALVFDLTTTIEGSETGRSFDVYLWSDAGGQPGAVLYMRPEVGTRELPHWDGSLPVPTERDSVAISYGPTPAGTWWAGFWGGWPGELPGFYIAADLGGATFGCPMTRTLSGWADVPDEFTNAHSIGIGVLSSDPIFLTGACELASSSCIVTSRAGCVARGATYLGDGVVCSPSRIDSGESVTGACCLDFNDVVTCRVLTISGCAAECGSYQGDDVPCSPNPCSYMVVATSPDSGETSVEWGPILQADFSGAVNPTTVTSESFLVRGANSGGMSGDVSAFGSRAEFFLDASFHAGEQIEAELTDQVVSANGESLTGGHVWQFRSASECGSDSPLLHTSIFTDVRAVSAAAGDLDRDGDNDLVTCGLNGRVLIYMNTAVDSIPPGEPPIYETPIQLGPSTQWASLTLADFNRDRYLDVVASVQAEGFERVWVFLNPGEEGLGWQPRSFAVNGNGRPQRLGVGDLNGDGAVDIVTPCEVTGELNVLLGNGAQGLIGSYVYRLPHFEGTGDGCPGNCLYDVQLADVEPDGDLDVIAMWPDGATRSWVTVLKNTHSQDLDSLLVTSCEIELPFRAVGILVENIGGRVGPEWVCDANSMMHRESTPGSPDIFVVPDNGPFIWRYDMGLGVPDGPTVYDDGFDSNDLLRSLAPIDYDGDGDLDLALTARGTDRCYLIRNDGSASLTVVNSFSTGDRPQQTVTADLNGDRIMDVAIPNRDDRTLKVFLGQRVGASTVPLGSLDRNRLTSWPNPFTSEVTFGLRSAEKAEIDVFDIGGRLVKRIAVPSNHEGTIVWDGRGEHGHVLPHGVYWVRASTGNRTENLTLVKVESP